jgi:hypothetical protein
MMKNYSSLMMKDSKFRDNMIVAPSSNSTGTPFVQYLIKNNKYKVSAEQKKRKRPNDEPDEITTATKVRGQRSSTSFQQQQDLTLLVVSNSVYKDISLMENRSSHKIVGKSILQGMPADRKGSQETFNEMSKSDSQKSLVEAKHPQKLITSMKRYASKERFMKILDQIACTSIKETGDAENAGDDSLIKETWVI